MEATLAKFATPLVGALVMNEGGKYAERNQNVSTADHALSTQRDVIENNPYLSDEEKGEFTKKALDRHAEQCSRQPKGPVVDMMKWETAREAVGPTIESVKEGVKSWWKR